MKKTACIIGAIGTIMLCLGALFKMLHFPGSAVMLLFALGALLPVAAVFTTIAILTKK